MVCVRRDFKDPLVPSPFPWAGTAFTRPGVTFPAFNKENCAWGSPVFLGIWASRRKQKETRGACAAGLPHLGCIQHKTYFCRAVSTEQLGKSHWKLLLNIFIHGAVGGLIRYFGMHQNKSISQLYKNGGSDKCSLNKCIKSTHSMRRLHRIISMLRLSETKLAYLHFCMHLQWLRLLHFVISDI